MLIVKNGLLIGLAIVLAGFSLPSAHAQQSSADSAHPLRLKRPYAETQSPQIQAPETQPAQTTDEAGTHLQGGVTRIGVFSEPADPAQNPLSSVLRQGFPSPDNSRAPLTGRAEGYFDTPPVMVPLEAVSAPPPVYRGWIEKAHPQFSLTTNKMADNRLVVIYDKYDDTGRTLSSLGLQFTTVNKKQFDLYDLSAAQVLVVDCGPNRLSLQAMQKIRDFVARGGYLFTTDWMLDRLDQLIFPGYIAWNGAMNSQKMYDARIVGNNPVLFKHAVSNAFWKMDIHCHLIRVLNKEAVRVLAVSPSLVLDDPDRQGILAVVFPFGRGYVMHMTAHFDRSQQFFGYHLPDPAPIIGISLRQAIAINYVVAGLTGTKP